MNSRERVIRTIEFRKPDRIPISHSIALTCYIKYGESLAQILKRYPDDFSGPVTNYPRSIAELPASLRKGFYIDEWGCRIEVGVDGLFGQPVGEPPLADYSRLADVKFPVQWDRGHIKNMAGTVAERKKQYFTMSFFQACGYFERLQWLRGYENLMMDLAEMPKEFLKLSNELLDWNLERIGLLTEVSPDCIFFEDDWGTQNSLMIDPGLWREFFKPRYRKMVEAIHKTGAYAYFHSDGYIVPIFNDLIEIGVDILNPQFSCHTLEDMAGIFRGRITIATDIDRQRLLPFGRPDEIEGYIRNTISLLWQNGGLIGRGEVYPEIPLENIETLYKTFFEEILPFEN